MAVSVLRSNGHDLEQVASLFRVLGDPTRLQILVSLANGEKHVTAICAELGLPQPTASHHLALLRMNNIVGHHRVGKQMYYGLEGQVEVTEDNDILIYVQHICIRMSAR